MTNFAAGKAPFFEGWYLKHQHESETICVIPALHRGEGGIVYASIQVISSGGTWYFEYPAHRCIFNPSRFFLKIGPNIFSNNGMALRLKGAGITLHGKVEYGPFSPLPLPIMGPFALVPNMQCNHGVLSLHHTLAGRLVLNGTVLNFSGGTGYIEKDWGSAFPTAYSWTHCANSSNTPAGIMLAVATVPIAGRHFTGCIASVQHRGKNYLFASYLGAFVQRWREDEVIIRQGLHTLTTTFIQGNCFVLQAPVLGEMGREVVETPRGKAHYVLKNGRRTLFSFTADTASFESDFT